ncbi:hypothetical protein MRX96_044254 [Rhipicephalus microplus]
MNVIFPRHVRLCRRQLSRASRKRAVLRARGGKLLLRVDKSWLRWCLLQRGRIDRYSDAESVRRNPEGCCVCNARLSFANLYTRPHRFRFRRGADGFIAPIAAENGDEGEAVNPLMDICVCAEIRPVSSQGLRHGSTR